MKTIRENLTLFHEQIPYIYGEIERFIYKLTLDNNAKEEILQDSLEIALKNIHQLRDPKKLKQWIFSIARRQAIQYYIKEHKAMPGTEGAYRSAPNDENQSGSPLEKIIREEQTQEFSEAFENMDAKYAKVLVLRHYYDMPLVDIAEKLNKNYSTIGCHYQRGLRQFRTELERRGIISLLLLITWESVGY